MDPFSVFDEIEETLRTVRIDAGCAHTEKCVDGHVVVCTECGSEIENIKTYDAEWRNYSTSTRANPTRCIARRVDEPVIMKDLKHMNLSKHIIDSANDMYVKVTKGKIKRGKSSRKAIISACLFYAFKQHGSPKSCDMMREIMSDTRIDKSDFLHGIKQVALNLDKSSGVHLTYITPEDIITEHLSLLNSSPAQKHAVIALYRHISPHTRMFRESRPQSVSAGVVYEYMLSHKKPMPIKEFCSKVKISELTVNKIRSEIARILIDHPHK